MTEARSLRRLNSSAYDGHCISVDILIENSSFGKLVRAVNLSVRLHVSYKSALFW